MLIISQKKDKIINFDRITGIGVSMINHNQICTLKDDGGPLLSLGNYSDERCKEVLKDIAQCYEESLMSNVMTDHAAMNNRPYIYAENKVYWMPEK